MNEIVFGNHLEAVLVSLVIDEIFLFQVGIQTFLVKETWLYFLSLRKTHSIDALVSLLSFCNTLLQEKLDINDLLFTRL